MHPLPHFEAGFKLQHDCPLTRFTQKYPTAVIHWWCNYNIDIIDVSPKSSGRTREFDQDFHRLIRDLGGKQVRRTATDSGLQAVVHCSCLSSRDSVAWLIERHRCLEVYPAVYTQGWEWYRLIALSGTDLKGFFTDLGATGRVEIISKKVVKTGSIRDTFAISTASLFGDLSDKQSKAFRYALDRGYYALPKGISTRTMAKNSGVTRTTFEEHLRKAQSKVMRSLAPYVLFSGGD